MLKEKLPKIGIGVGIIVLVALIVFVKFYILDAADVYIAEYYKGIRYGMDRKDAGSILASDGHIEIEEGWIYKVNDFGGVEGANGMVSVSGGSDKVENVICFFKVGEGEQEIDAELLDKLAKGCIRKLDKKIDKKIDEEEHLEILKAEGGDYDESKAEYLVEGQTIWLGENSCITITYIESTRLTIDFEDINSERAQYYLSVDR